MKKPYSPTSSAVTDRVHWTSTDNGMNNIKRYYNEFYRQHFLDLDEEGNDFSKISPLWPQISNSARVLDIGCGAGSVSAHLVKKGYEVYGLDIQEEAVRRAQQKGLKAQVYDISRKLPFTEAFFDCVLALDILEHIFDPMACLREVHRVLKPDGHVIVTLPLHFNLRERLRILLGKGIIDIRSLSLDKAGILKSWTFDHIRFFTLAEAKEMFRQAGFKTEMERYSFARLRLPWGINRIEYRVISRLPGWFAQEIKVSLRRG